MPGDKPDNPGNRLVSTAGDEGIDLEQSFGFSDDCGIARVSALALGYVPYFANNDMGCKKFGFQDFPMPAASFSTATIAVVAQDCDTTPKCKKALFEATYHSSRGHYLWQQVQIAPKGVEPCTTADLKNLYLTDEDLDLLHKESK